MVTAFRAGPNRFWHPACFGCDVCKEILVDLVKINPVSGGQRYRREVIWAKV
jgi:hypothetical protein